MCLLSDLRQKTLNLDVFYLSVIVSFLICCVIKWIRMTCFDLKHHRPSETHWLELLEEDILDVCTIIKPVLPCRLSPAFQPVAAVRHQAKHRSPSPADWDQVVIYPALVGLASWSINLHLYWLHSELTHDSMIKWSALAAALKSQRVVAKSYFRWQKIPLPKVANANVASDNGIVLTRLNPLSAHTRVCYHTDGNQTHW